jgi:hypothetical protein
MHLPHYSTNRVLDQNHITLLILTSCRVLAAITTVLGSAAPVVAAPLISRGSVVCILGSCCADGEVSLARGSGALMLPWSVTSAPPKLSPGEQ